MKYLDLLADAHWAYLRDWLAASRELMVDIYLPRSPSSSSKWFVRSLADIRSLVRRQHWPEIVITIYRECPYSIRGVADEQLLRTALQAIPDNTSFSIFAPGQYYPKLGCYLGGGDTHEELTHELRLHKGAQVILGADPDPSDKEWIYSFPIKALQFEVTKNLHA